LARRPEFHTQANLYRLAANCGTRLSFSYSSSVKRKAAAATFSSRCLTEEVPGKSGSAKNSLAQCLVNAASSTGRCNTIWYKAAFKGGVYDPKETVWAFGGAEERYVVPLEGGTVVA
jgi:hypothetical protein